MTLRTGSALAAFMLLLVMQADGFGQPRRRGFSYSRPVQATRATYQTTPAKSTTESTPAAGEATPVVPAAFVSMQAPESTGPTPMASSCGCGGGPSGDGPCIKSPNCHYAITPYQGTPHLTTKPIDVTIPTDCDPATTVNIPFYKEKHDGEGTISLPKKIVNVTEVFRFKNVTYKLCGCEICICVPCAIDCVSVEKCVPTPTKVQLQARVRTAQVNGVYVADIWAVGVSGLPSEAVLVLSVKAAEANAKFGTNFSY